MATLLPNGVQQFLDQNAVPLARGTVAFYVPGTLTPKQTWQDSAATILNSNPVVLNSSGEAIIYGSGAYRQIVYDAAGNLIWDQLTADTAVGGLAWGGTSTGTPNAQVIAASSFSQQDGQQVSFIVGTGLTNTGATTITLGSGAPISILKDTPAGPTSLTGGELVAGNVASLTYDATRGAFHLTDQPIPAVPTGSIAQFIMSAIPNGYLLADGTAVSRSTYAALNQLASAAAYAAPWGPGDGTTTFNVPNLLGLFSRAWNGTGSGPDAGRAIGTTQADAYLNHSHGVTDPGHNHLISQYVDNSGSSGGFTVSGGLSIVSKNVNTNTTGISVNTSTTGGTETRPKNISLAYAIKT